MLAEGDERCWGNRHGPGACMQENHAMLRRSEVVPMEIESRMGSGGRSRAFCRAAWQELAHTGRVRSHGAFDGRSGSQHRRRPLALRHSLNPRGSFRSAQKGQRTAIQNVTSCRRFRGRRRGIANAGLVPTASGWRPQVTGNMGGCGRGGSESAISHRVARARRVASQWHAARAIRRVSTSRSCGGRARNIRRGENTAAS